MNIKNKPTIIVGLVVMATVFLGLLIYLLQFPLTGLKSKLFFSACPLTKCGEFQSKLKDFHKTIKKKDFDEYNSLAMADLFVNFYFLKHKEAPVNYAMALKQYNRLVIKYKKLPTTKQNLTNFKKDYNDFHHCHKNLSSYYLKEETQAQEDLRKLDLFLFSSATMATYENFFKGFMSQKNLKEKDLSSFQSAVLINDRCNIPIDDTLNIQLFIATKGKTVDLRSIQKDIIQFEARFGKKFRERYQHLIHLDTQQYLDQSLSL